MHLIAYLFPLFFRALDNVLAAILEFLNRKIGAAKPPQPPTPKSPVQARSKKAKGYVKPPLFDVYYEPVPGPTFRRGLTFSLS
jgi:hypothetical protein